jgi:non-ribosomal peptide synthetase component E (peptide arylation enzyme)
MIVGTASTDNHDVARTTLDDLFRRAAVRNPDAVALVDPDDRAHFTGGEPRQLTYAQADRIVWAIAARLRALGLQTDSVVGVQLPNTTEHILTLLGILRAGMIAAPLPMLWRETEIIAALSGVGARAIVATSRIGSADHCAVAGRVAAGLFSIRHVCAFGENLADGIVALDDVMSAATDTVVLETRRGPKGTLLLRGDMVAAPGFAAAEAAVPPPDFADTGYPCRNDPGRGALVVTGPQPGMIGIGGYRIARNEIDTFAAALPTDSPIAALPDGLLGQRLRGRAADPAAAKLAARSANPLIGGAFSDPR